MKTELHLIKVKMRRGKILLGIEVIDLTPQSKSEVQWATKLREQIPAEDVSRGRSKVVAYRPRLATQGPARGRVVYPIARNGTIRTISPQALVILANNIHPWPNRTGDGRLAGLRADVGAGWTEKPEGAISLHLLSKDRRRELVFSSPDPGAIGEFVTCLVTAFDNQTFSCDDCLVFSKKGDKTVSVKFVPDRRNVFPFGRKVAPEEDRDVERLIIAAATFDEMLSSCMQHGSFLQQVE